MRYAPQKSQEWPLTCPRQLQGNPHDPAFADETTAGDVSIPHSIKSTGIAESRDSTTLARTFSVLASSSSNSRIDGPAPLNAAPRMPSDPASGKSLGRSGQISSRNG